MARNIPVKYTSEYWNVFSAIKLSEMENCNSMRISLSPHSVIIPKGNKTVRSCQSQMAAGCRQQWAGCKIRYWFWCEWDTVCNRQHGVAGFFYIHYNDAGKAPKSVPVSRWKWWALTASFPDQACQKRRSSLIVAASRQTSRQSRCFVRWHVLNKANTQWSNQQQPVRLTMLLKHSQTHIK